MDEQHESNEEGVRGQEGDTEPCGPPDYEDGALDVPEAMVT